MADYDSIETPENVELRRMLAGIGSRFGAGLLDALVVVALYVVLALALMALTGTGFAEFIEAATGARGWLLAVMIMILFLIHWGYFAFFELVTNGQSPGKKLVRIRVVKEGGEPIAFQDVAIRNLLRVVDGLGLYGVGIVCMFLTRRYQRLGDLAAGTVVISEQVAEYAARTDRRSRLQLDESVSPEALRSTGLRPEHYRALASYWARRDELTLEARLHVLPELLRPIMGDRLARDRTTSLEAMEERVAELLGDIVEKADATQSDGGEGAP